MKNHRRYIATNLSPKTKKEKESIIYRFLLFCKKDLKIKNFSELSPNTIQKYQKSLMENGAWNRSKKQYIHISEKKIQEHIATIRNFHRKISIIR